MRYLNAFPPTLGDMESSTIHGQRAEDSALRTFGPIVVENTLEHTDGYNIGLGVVHGRVRWFSSSHL